MAAQSVGAAQHPGGSPDAGLVQLWCAQTDAPGLDSQRLAAYLTPAERERVARYRFERDRARHTYARGLLRLVLGGAAGLHPRAVELVTGPFGKPELLPAQNSLGLRFNLSYGGDWLLLALTRGCEVGVDLEPVRALPDAIGIAERFFHRDEKDSLHAAAEDKQSPLFFTYWTRKEALLKALGTGLSDQALAAFNSADLTSAPLVWRQLSASAGPGKDWWLVDLAPRPGYAACLVLPEPRRLVFQDIRYLSDLPTPNPPPETVGGKPKRFGDASPSPIYSPPLGAGPGVALRQPVEGGVSSYDISLLNLPD